MNHKKKASLILISSLFVALVILLPTFLRDKTPKFLPFSPIKLGLDLKGGAYLVMKVITTDAVKSSLTHIGNAVRADLKHTGTSVLRTRQVGDRDIEITVFNDKQVEKVKEHVKANFSELEEPMLSNDGSRIVVRYRMKEQKAREIEELAVGQAIDVIRNRVDMYGVGETSIQRLADKLIMVQIPDIQNLEELKNTIGKVAKLEFKLVADPNSEEEGIDTKTYKAKDGSTVKLEEEVLMTGDAVQQASADFSRTGASEVSLKLTPTGARTFDNLTGENVNRRLAIVLDGMVQSSPRINERISGGNAQISGSFTAAEAHQLAVVLRSGALPAELQIETERTVGPSMGADSIRRGFMSFVAGSIVLLLFMFAYYKRSGLVAVISLIYNITFLLALLSLMGGTLTLPGLAGMVLTLAMAVDANVLIFERMKEELATGASVGGAIQAGYDKVHWAIMDANITTLISGIVLYVLGTGPIKGFAVTLNLGILTTLIGALYISRLCFDVVPVARADSKMSI